MNNKNITIYSTPSCHFCHKAKEFLEKHNVSFTDHNVAEDSTKLSEMMEKSGQMGVPVIAVDDPSGETEIIIGFNEPLLKTLLAI